MWKILTFLSLALGLAGWLAIPDIPGFAVLPFVLALIFAIVHGPGRWKADFGGLNSPAARQRLTVFSGLAALLAAALLAGSVSLFPSYDFGRSRVLSLSPESSALLARLEDPVTITVHMGPQHSRFAAVQDLMNRYEKTSKGLVSVKYLNPQTNVENSGLGPRLVSPDTALVETAGFKENISPVTEDVLNKSLDRLLNPDRRLVYFLNTFGEKMVRDDGPAGLSHWRQDMETRRLISLDYYWPDNSALPREAAVLVLAGPKAPLGEFREKMLKNYLENGGRLIIMADPLTVSFSDDFWKPFGLKMPDGLVINPETNLAGTSETYTITEDYPSHPLTTGLGGPMVWPLAGCFQTLEKDGHADLPATTFAVALSSPAAWLETDLRSLNDVRYQHGQDIAGPLAMAIAIEMKGGGRLVALADSDLASNMFQGFPGNRNFLTASVNWLLERESGASIVRDGGQSVSFNRISARLTFWLPVVVWPAFILIIWLVYYQLRRGRKNRGDRASGASQ